MDRGLGVALCDEVHPVGAVVAEGPDASIVVGIDVPDVLPDPQALEHLLGGAGVQEVLCADSYAFVVNILEIHVPLEGSVSEAAKRVFFRV